MTTILYSTRVQRVNNVLQHFYKCFILHTTVALNVR